MASDAGARRRRDWNRPAGGYVTLGAVRYSVRRAPAPARRIPPVAACARDCCAACAACANCATCAPGPPRADLLAGCLGRRARADRASPDRRRTLERLQRFRFGRAASGERERRGGSVDAARPPERPRTDRTERLRELTERLRGRASFAPSPAPTPSPAPHSAPVLPVVPPVVPPVPPPRHRHSRDSFDLTLCCPSPSVQPKCDVKWKRDRTIHKADSVNGEFDKCKQEDESRKEDFFDADDFHLVKVEPRSIVGSYAQKTIPFRSASFSQVDFNTSDGKYMRNLPRNVSLNSISNAPTRLENSSLSTICSGSEPSASTGLSTPQAGDPASETITEAESTASVDSAVGSDEGLLGHVALSPRMPQIAGEPAHKQLGMRSLTHPLPSRSANGGSDVFNVIDGKGVRSLQCFPQGSLSGVLHEVHEESDASLADSAQAQSETVSPVDRTSLTNCFIFPTPGLTQCETCFAQINVLDENVVENIVNDQKYDTPQCSCSKSNASFNSSEEIAMANVIPVPVYECIVKEWTSAGSVEDWLDNERIEPPLPHGEESQIQNKPDIAMQDDSSLNIQQGQDSKEDETITSEQVENLLAAVQNSSKVAAPVCKERKRALDKTKRRNGIYITNAQDDILLTLPESIVATDFNKIDNNHGGDVIKLETGEREVFIGDPDSQLGFCQKLRSNTSIDSDMKNDPSQEDWFPSNTESPTPVDVANAPLWPKSVVETKWPFRPKLTYQSSDEKDEESLNKANNRKCSLLLRADSLSEGESESGSVSTSNRDRTASPSPFNPSDVSDTETRSLAGKERGSHVTRRSIRPVRGPYGQMLEAERNKADFSKLSKHDEETKFINELTAQGTARFMNPNMSASRTSLSSIASPVAHGDPRPGNRTRHGNRSFDEKDLKSNKSFLDPPADKSNIRSSPKRKVSANIPYSAPNPVTESASGLVVCHQRTTSSPSKLEGLSPRNSSESKKKVNHDLLAELLRGSSEALSNGSKFDNVILCIQQNNDTRTHVVVELYDTECSYVESLEILVKKYLQPLKSPENSGLVDAFLVDEIFYQVPAILAVHQVFLEELRKRLEAWDVNQKIGDVFLNVFGKPSVMETYMSFINNWTKAKDTIKTASASRPAFARFLQAMARDHKGKLSLDNLLIKPVQKFPRYEMLIQRLIKHTDTAHPDHKLLKEAQREIHDLLVKINCTERESLELEQQQQMLRELEALVEGLAHLVTADRTFLRHDTVTIPSGQGTTKERALFLFSDLLLITSVKRRTGTIKKPIAACQSSLASILEANKYKLLMRISLADLEIVKAKDENLRRVMREVETLTEDVTTLTQISELTAALHSTHHQLEETVRDMLLAANRQLAERQNSDSQLCCLEMSLTISSGAENLSFIFPKPEKRSSWEEIFTETKQKLALSDDKRPTPEFLSPVPIRKTRAGLQFTCAAPTLPVATSSSRDVWVCNSDGYVGQVCVLTLQPKPQVTSCNGVCNARILCVACVPAASQQSASGHTSVVRQRTVDVGSSGHSFTGSIKPGISISDADDGLKNIRLDSSSSSEEDEDGSSTSENQDNHLESKDHSTSLQASLKNIQSTSLNSTLTPSHSKSLSTPHSSQNITVHPVMKSSSNPAVDKQAMGISTGTLSTPASRQSSEDSSHASNQPTMWLGTEDGCIHVYNCNDNIRIKKNKIKLQHSSGVHCIVYVDSKVFVSLGNGDIVVYMRDIDGAWCEHKSILVGTSTCPVTKMLLSAGKLWCAQHTNVRIIDPETIQMEDSFQVGGDSLKPISHMAISGAGVWIALHNTALLKCFHAETREVITELNITPAVTKMLAGSDDIIRQHKAACLRVTSLLACKDILWVGTSAGVLLTANLSNMQQPNGQIVAPQLAGIPYGHTGHVRFLTVVETTMASTNPTKVTSQTAKSKLSNRRTLQSLATTTKAPETGTSGPKDLLVISGGDGYEDFRNSSVSEDAGREDSTNHLLLWKI